MNRSFPIGRRRRATARTVAALVGLTVALSACSASSARVAPPPANGSTTTTVARTDPAGTVWLCRPGLTDDPCASDLTETVVAPSGATTVVPVHDAADPPVDCFYVYPTVSRQTTENANLDVDPEETAVAIAQAASFSQVCRVYAPMYPQLTLSGIGLNGRKIEAAAAAKAFLGVLSAWRDYLAHFNDGRGVVLIGHSQGASMLIALIRAVIDSRPAERRRLVSALILGGNVTVPVGGDVGGDFTHIPACRSQNQVGCVVAYSSFDTTPPATSLFGRVGASLTARSGLGPKTNGDLHVLCTNPASLAGGAGTLSPAFPTQPVPGAGATFQAGTAAHVSTPWVVYPDLYSATCESSGGANWLQVTDIAGPTDQRPVVRETLGPTWGLHLVDVNIAMGNLVDLVRDEAQAYTS